MAQLSDEEKFNMGGPQQFAAEGDSWTASDPLVDDGGLPVRDPLVPGINSPDITGIGWRRMINRMLSAKGIR